MPSNHLNLCGPLLLQLQSFPASGSFPMNQFFASDGNSIGNSASASVLQMNIQDWFPLRLTCLISLQSKGLSRVFSNTTVQKHQFASPGSMQDMGSLGLVHWDDPEGWYGEGGGRRVRLPTPIFAGFPCGSAGKESTCNVGDLHWEDPLEKGKATHSSILTNPIKDLK